MEEKIVEIASRVHELRELSKVSIEGMAEHLKVPVDTYRRYENGEQEIPASILFEMAQKLGVDMALLLTGKEPRMQIFTVTRKDEGVLVERRKQYEYQNLAGKFKNKKAEPFIVTVEPRPGKPEVYSHKGQEFNYLLEGCIKIYIHDNEIILNQGDSIYFDSSYAHAMEAMLGRSAKMLVVVM